MSQYPQIYFPPLGRVNKAILGSWVGIFLLESLARLADQFSLASLLALSPARFLAGDLWQLFTYPFVHVQMWDLLLHALVLAFMGSALEQRWGERRYAVFLAFTALGVGLLYLGLAMLIPSLEFLSLYGGGAWLFAMATTYALLEPDAMFSLMFVFPVRARTAVLLLLGLELYSGIFSPLRQAALANLAGALLALVWVKGPTWRARARMNSAPGRRAGSQRSFKSSHLKLVDDAERPKGESKSDPKYWQ